MTDENGAVQPQFLADLDEVFGVAGQARILRWIICGEIGPAGSDMIEQDRSKVVLKRGRHEPPRVLVAAVAVGEDHRPSARPLNPDIVATASRHVDT